MKYIFLYIIIKSTYSSKMCSHFVFNCLKIERVPYQTTHHIPEDSNFNCNICLRFEVILAVTMKGSVFWDVTPCSLVEMYQTIQCHVPEDSGLHYLYYRETQLMYIAVTIYG